MKNFKRSIPLPINENINTIAFDGIVGRQFSIISKTTGANVNFDKSAKVRVQILENSICRIIKGMDIVEIKYSDMRRMIYKNVGGKKTIFPK